MKNTICNEMTIAIDYEKQDVQRAKTGHVRIVDND